MAKVLLVEDDEALMTITKAILTDMGHAVVEASDGRKGLAAALAHKPDIILSDFLMPGVIDGGEKKFFDELASNPQTKDIPIIITSGLPKMAVEPHVPKRMWPNIMSKPFDYLELKNVIDKVLKQKKP
ncbi:MAG: two-component system response regulator [Elusimicrobiota bacterium]